MALLKHDYIGQKEMKCDWIKKITKACTNRCKPKQILHVFMPKKNFLKVKPIYLFITHINDDKIATMLNTVKCGQAAPMYDTSVRLYMYTVHCTPDLYCAT